MAITPLFGRSAGRLRESLRFSENCLWAGHANDFRVNGAVDEVRIFMDFTEMEGIKNADH